VRRRCSASNLVPQPCAQRYEAGLARDREGCPCVCACSDARARTKCTEQDLICGRPCSRSRGLSLRLRMLRCMLRAPNAQSKIYFVGFCALPERLFRPQSKFVHPVFNTPACREFCLSWLFLMTLVNSKSGGGRPLFFPTVVTFLGRWKGNFVNHAF
jgi:hypothetical protein